MANPKGSYASYLLRLRQVQNDNQATWVASIQSTKTGELRSFRGVDALLEFLQAQFGRCGQASAAGPDDQETGDTKA